MSTANRRAAVDHFAEAFRGALAIRPAHAAQALASDASDPWVSTEWPRPFPRRSAATQIPAGPPLVGSPTRSPIPHHDGRPAVLNSPAVLAGRK